MVIGVTQGPTWALALLIAVLCHELGHYLVARALGGQGALVMQVGSGRPYLKGIAGLWPSIVVLLAGGVAAFVPFTASLYMQYFGAKLRAAIILWTLYQWLPYPSLDGGQILIRTVLARVDRTLTKWRILWVVGVLTAVALGWAFPLLAKWLMYFTVMALLLGRSEAGPLRYADAYESWEAGDHSGVVDRALQAPRYLSEDELEALTVLGLASARALDNADAIDNLCEGLPPHHPERVRAAEYLLRHEHAEGPTLARLAFEAYDRGRVTQTELDSELWADLAFHAASAEAKFGHRDEALDFLERAASLGFDHLDRLEADPQLSRLEEQPRYQAVVERLRASGA